MLLIQEHFWVVIFVYLTDGFFLDCECAAAKVFYKTRSIVLNVKRFQRPSLLDIRKQTIKKTVYVAIDLLLIRLACFLYSESTEIGFWRVVKKKNELTTPIEAIF